MSPRRAFLAVLLSAAVTAATPAEVLELAPAGEGHRLTNRVIFVVDVSGSMRADDRLDQALGAFTLIAEDQVTDDLEIAVIAFDDRAVRWPGVPEPASAPPVPPGWARMPSLAAAMSAKTWLVGCYQNRGTEPAEALRAALAEPREGTSVVFVTDGEYAHPPVLEVLAAHRDAGGCVTVATLLVSAPKPHLLSHLEAFAKVGGGGLWLVQGRRGMVTGPW